MQKTLSPMLASPGPGVLWAEGHIALIAVKAGDFGAFVLSNPEWIAIGLTLIDITTHGPRSQGQDRRTGSIPLCAILHGRDETGLPATMTGLLGVSTVGLKWVTGGHLGKASATPPGRACP